MNIDADIERAFQTVATAVAATLGLPIYFPGITNDSGNARRYLEVTHFRNTVLSNDWGTRVTYRGIYQISLIDKINNTGIERLTITKTIVDGFQKNKRFNHNDAYVKITEQPSVLSPVVNPEFTEIPVSIPYLAREA